MQKIEPLTYGKYYHIYNCGINGSQIFRHAHDYEYFLADYERYIEPVADTYAWCLMGNHLHLLLRIKEEDEIKTFFELQPLAGLKTTNKRLPLPESATTERLQLPVPSVANGPDGDHDDKWKTRKPKPSTQFSHLFNSYAQVFNQKYHRRGALFERPFKRKRIHHPAYFKSVVLYIHNTPVHHGFCEHPLEYPWSSYLTCISIKPTRLKRDAVIGWFDNEANFKHRHNDKVDLKKLKDG